jgi:hypothetical protein
VESLRKTYILRVWNAAPAETAAGAQSDAASPSVADGQSQSSERFFCSLQPIASEEIHYFASIEETIRFIRNSAIAFRSKPG